VLKLFVVGQEILNGDVGGGLVFKLLGSFNMAQSGITSELQLYSTAIGGLVMAAAMFCWLVPLHKCTKT
jgi:photosystem I P700 chlorophyll a apoprotein A1